MGSTGDRAASLMLEGREAGAWGRAASGASYGLPQPANSIINEATRRTAIEAVLTVGVCAASGINLPTDAYDASLGRVFAKSRLLERVVAIGALIKPFHLCTLGDGKG
jgi:hypothetical protein